jgi:hypothetical protein
MIYLTLKEWQKTIKPISNLIVQASSMECDDGWRNWPIGMSWQYVLNYQEGNMLQIGDHSNLCLCAISHTTDLTRRPEPINRRSILNTLYNNGISNISLDHSTYFNTLPSYKFVISPEGNGIDCHRHYEALMAGCIPIIEHNALIKEKYKGCPILYTSDYSEITPEYLETKYTEMINTQYDFSSLSLSTYDKETQDLIKASGNFWLQRINETRCIWYL